MSQEYRTELITDDDRLRELAPAWWELWQRCPHASPFQSPAWVLPWREQLGHGRLWTTAVYQGDTLVGLAPCFLYQDAAVRRLLILGTSLTDQMDLLLDPAGEAAALQTLVRFWQEHASDWDVADLQEICPRSPLQRLPVTGLCARREQCGVRPVVTLPASMEAWQASLGSGLRRNLRRYRQQMQKEGPVSFALADARLLPQMMDALIKLHETRWDGAGMLRDERVRRFHVAAARELLAHGLLRLHGLHWRGEWVAIVYAFAAKGRGYSYLGGFAPELSRYTPGTLIMGQAIGEAVAEGLHAWDFLRGEEAYKYSWQAGDEPNYRIRWWHPDSPEAAYAD